MQPPLLTLRPTLLPKPPTLLPKPLTLLLKPLLRLLTLLPLRLKLRLPNNLRFQSENGKGVVFGPRPFCLGCMGSETKLPHYQ